MRSIFRVMASVIFASCAAVASAQTTTLTFDDLTIGSTISSSASYNNYVFSRPSALFDPGPDYVIAGPLNVFASAPAYNTGMGNNITPFAPSGTSGLKYSVFSLSIAGGGSFYFSSVDAAGSSDALFHLTFADGSAGETYLLDGMLPTGQTFFNPLSDRAITSIQFAGVTEDGNAAYTAFDNIVVGTQPIAPVPEPSAYAMMLAGLGALTVIARRRKFKAA